MPSAPATSDPAARTVDEQFLDLICNDPDLLAAEFDAIIAAEWPQPPPDRPARGAASGHPGMAQPAARPSLSATRSLRHDGPAPADGHGNAHPVPTPDPPQAERQLIATREPTRTR
jgi:hypothetical protein